MVEPKGDGKAATAGMARNLWQMVLAPIALIVAGVVGFVADVGELRSRWLTPDPHTCEPYEHELIPCMLDVQPGAYTMGAPPKERGRYRSEGPTRRVSIEYPFAVSAYEITRAQFAHFVDESGYETRGPCSTLAKGRDWGDWELRRDHNWRTPGFEQDDRHPVTCVSWHDAVAYTEWLTREKGGVYRLPSEAEWEYVARAGTTTARHWGVDAAKQCEYANGANRSMSWCYGCVCDDRHENTAPVGSYASNDWGLFDVLGSPVGCAWPTGTNTPRRRGITAPDSAW